MVSKILVGSVNMAENTLELAEFVRIDEGHSLDCSGVSVWPKSARTTIMRGICELLSEIFPQ